MNSTLRYAVVTIPLVLLSFGIHAQHYVKRQPGRPAGIVQRSPSPVANSIWIEEDWKWNGKRFMWAGGYWARPPYVGAVWIPGRWVHTRYGWQWVAGRWHRPTPRPPVSRPPSRPPTRPPGRPH